LLPILSKHNYIETDFTKLLKNLFFIAFYLKYRQMLRCSLFQRDFF